MDPSSGYLAQTKTNMARCETPRECRATVRYSLPGPCPGLSADGKTAECRQRMQGGLCRKVTGAANCTYSVEEAGWVGLDELAGIDNYSAFVQAGHREYSED